MFVNNLRLALRNLWKKRSFSMLNIMGLAVGLSSAFVILTYIREELSYDRFHKNADVLYRITEEYKDDSKQIHYAINHGPLADILNGRMTGLKHTIRMMPHSAYVSVDKVNKHREDAIIFADSVFFDAFTFEPVNGDLTTALAAPFSVVMTESMAQKYFSSTDVVGREIHYEDERSSYSFTVTAVIKDVPSNSHFRFDFLFNMASLETIMHWYNNWHYPPMYIYLQTESGVSVSSIEEQIHTLAKKYQPAEILEEKRKYTAQPITSIHLHSSLADEWEANSDISYVKLFAGVAVFLLVIACINFMNLSTAQAAQRAREVGVRKVLGAFRQQLVKQFLAEAFLISLISLLLALGVAELMLMTLFGSLTGKQLSIIFLAHQSNWIYIVILLFVITLLAGLYPAFYLARFKPVLTLKGKTEEPGGAFGLRRGLVVFQFFISGLLIIGTFAVLQQVNLLKNKNLGFHQHQLITLITVDRFSKANYLTLKNKLLESTMVESVALSAEVPGGKDFHGFEVIAAGFESGTLNMNTLGMDEDFIPTYDIEVIAGRNFSVNNPADAKEGFILNESAVKFLGWTAQGAIGKDFGLVVYTGGREERKGKVIGVVKDFHFESLHNKIEPLVLYINKHLYYSDFLTVKLNASSPAQAAKYIESTWKSFHPDKPAEYFFLDDRLQRMYAFEMKMSNIFSSFAILSVFISCLGLFGLSAYSAQRRIKEIGIRKVMGASVLQILRLISREYVVLIIVANVLSWPLAYYAMSQWLSSFPYRIDIGISLLAITLLIGLVIALVTISVQSLKAAMVNPVKCLRNE